MNSPGFATIAGLHEPSPLSPIVHAPRQASSENPADFINFVQKEDGNSSCDSTSKSEEVQLFQVVHVKNNSQPFLIGEKSSTKVQITEISHTHILPQETSTCPLQKKLSPAETEIERIRQKNPLLVSTGCTPKPCQSGRMIHTDEPRVGVNRALEEVIQEAEFFLREMFDEGIFKNEDEYNDRIQIVCSGIRANSQHSIIRNTGKFGFVGGSYHHTVQELEFGLRRSWRNARKCIMRSQCETMALKDLRHVTSSIEMANEVIDGIRHAFNGVAIKPTSFVFLPRGVDQHGPMIISQQFFAFAGYELEDGSILGDPGNLRLTKDIIGLGWIPPASKTRWDFLPFVALAERDAPAIVELPEDLQKLVRIRNPRYVSEFEALDLNWVVAPALSRMGFDIGGVQYTSAPFIEWFMDAEIGVRNLADTCRYNVLPSVVKALGLEAGTGTPFADLDDLPEFEKLSLLCKAQTELNYAVTWSYHQAGIAISDSLTASSTYINFDNAFKAKHLRINIVSCTKLKFATKMGIRSGVISLAFPSKLACRKSRRCRLMPQIDWRILRHHDIMKVR